MTLEELLSALGEDSLSSGNGAVQIVAFLNATLLLSGEDALTTATSGDQALVAVYKCPDEGKRDLALKKEFKGLRQKDSYKFTVLAMAILAVVVGCGYASTVVRTEGEIASEMTDVFKMIITGLFEVAKMMIAS